MKLDFAPEDRLRSQPDPFIFRDGDRFFLYVTAGPGVEAYSADSPFGRWRFEGVVAAVPGCRDYWAPCAIRLGGDLFLYVSCDVPGLGQCLHVLSARDPLGPFEHPRRLFDRFSIDAHAVETPAGLFLWYAADNLDAANGRVGTRVFLDRLLAPDLPARHPREVLVPTRDEEIFRRDRLGDGRDWHTLEGPFWLRRGPWQYLMYSGACFENDTYHVGYAAARTPEDDLLRVDFVKHEGPGGAFDPLLARNDFEEGVGHHSVLELDGALYAVYHGRDLAPEPGSDPRRDRRTARICRLLASPDGLLRAPRLPDRLA